MLAESPDVVDVVAVVAAGNEHTEEEWTDVDLPAGRGGIARFGCRCS